jgi:murein L,D-transpeptidase YcbB/YkuD
MTRTPRYLLAILIFSAGALPGSAVAQAGRDEVAQRLRGRVEAITAGLEAGAAGDRLLARTALPRFYEGRAFEPAWIGGGRPGPLVDDLLRAIDAVGRHGLDSADYHRAELAQLRASTPADAGALADLDLLATDAFLVLGSHLLSGRVNPETIDTEWLANRRGARMEEVLAPALLERRVAATLEGLAPGQPRYARIMQAAQRLRRIAEEGGWPEVPGGPKLEIGVSDARVIALRNRLRASGDHAQPDPEDPRVFDGELAESVRRFQARHGLDEDGIVGSATVAGLNVTAGERARQLDINLERWRWLPADLGARHIEVNIAGFYLDVVEDGRPVRSHRVVVGRQYRQTPMFSGRMTYLVLSPYWHVPPTIAAVDKLPLINADPSYIARQRMTLLAQAGDTPVDPVSVDWASMTGSDFNRRYRLRQDPGPMNALGQVKFMFPNRHNVYLHDTPSRELFAQTARSFSSGCIRVENPLDLAEYLLSREGGWTPAAIRAAASQTLERTVRLSEPVPVHLLYWTAWADADGTIHFREDIYGRDAVVGRALTE